MFQYTREMIINDQSFEKREDAKGGLEVFIPNVGSYQKEYIKGTFYTAAVAGSEASISVPANATGSAGGDVVRFTVNLKLQTGEVDALLSNYTTLFTRGMIVEVEAGANQDIVPEAF